MKITWIIIITILIFLICFTLTNLLIGAYNLGKWSCTLDAGSVGEPPLSPLEESKDGGGDNTPDLASDIIIAEITAYTSRPEEGTNCISASRMDICKLYESILKGFMVERENYYGEIYQFGYDANLIIACPLRYDFGTIIEIDNQQFVCVDRMGTEEYQNGNYFDIYFGQGEEAVKRAEEFGRRILEVKVYE